jgi:hypothetical protein
MKNDGTPYAYACTAWGGCAVPSTDCSPQAHCATCAEAYNGAEWTRALTNCLSCEAGYQQKKAVLSLRLISLCFIGNSG